MFTGVIEKTAKVESIAKKKAIHRLTLSVDKGLSHAKLGDSISVNGACLTVVAIKNNQFEFDVMKETFDKTSFRYLKKGDRVNTEAALMANSRLEGHFVLGHIDVMRKIKVLKKGALSYLDIEILPDDKKYVVKKASIAIDGISLTIGEIKRGSVRMFLIPYTLKNTSLENKKSGDWINVEFDILGKYILNKPDNKENPKQKITRGFLKAQGFI